MIPAPGSASQSPPGPQVRPAEEAGLALPAAAQALAYREGDTGAQLVVRSVAVAAVVYGAALTLRNAIDLLAAARFLPGGLRAGPGWRGLVGTAVALAVVAASPLLIWAGNRCRSAHATEADRVWLLRGLVAVCASEVAEHAIRYLWASPRMLYRGELLLGMSRELLTHALQLALPAFLLLLLVRPAVGRSFRPA